MSDKKELPSKGGSYVRQNGRLIPAEEAAKAPPSRPTPVRTNDNKEGKS